MRKVSIALAVIAYLIPLSVACSFHLVKNEGERDLGFLWIISIVASLMISCLLSAISIRLGYDGYLDVAAPRPLSRRIELAFLGLPLAAAIVLPITALISAIAG